MDVGSRLVQVLGSVFGTLWSRLARWGSEASFAPFALTTPRSPRSPPPGDVPRTVMCNLRIDERA